MDTLTEHQPALISTDAYDCAVVIPVGELRAIRDGRHDADTSQVEAMARFIVDNIDNA